MSKKFLLLVVIGVLGFFAWEHFSKPKVLTPQDQIEQLITTESVSATDLAEITDKFPDLVAKELRNRRITVTGVLKRASVKGVGSHDLILDLEGSRKRKITFTSDVNGYARANNLLGVSNQKFQKHGRDILTYESSAKATQSSSRAGVIQKLLGRMAPSLPKSVPAGGSADNAEKPMALTQRVVFRESDTVTFDGIFQQITNTVIHIEWRP
jgi:hypothetical protein